MLGMIGLVRKTRKRRFHTIHNSDLCIDVEG